MWGYVLKLFRNTYFRELTHSNHMERNSVMNHTLLTHESLENYRAT